MPLIVIEGLDGSGKTTQTALVEQRLHDAGLSVKTISFPDYRQESSALVRMYLSGAFSETADGVNAYAASSFYAVDRYASYKRFWQQDYEAGTVILATRYVSSNAIHQMSKLPKKEWDDFLHWLDDFEHEKLGLPRPDQVVFLQMSRPVADRLLMERYRGDVTKKDIHEKNSKYLLSCEKTALYAADKQAWSMIRCDDGERPFAADFITDQIIKQLKGTIRC